MQAYAERPVLKKKPKTKESPGVVVLSLAENSRELVVSRPDGGRREIVIDLR